MKDNIKAAQEAVQQAAQHALNGNIDAAQEAAQWAMRNVSAKYDKEAIALQHGCILDEGQEL